MLGLTASLTACQTYKVIPADKTVVRMPAGKAYVPSIDGWFTPDARMAEILDQLSAKKILGTNSP